MATLVSTQRQSMRHVRIIRLLAALSFVGAPHFATAQRPAKPTVILFVGNSFLHGQFQPVRSYNVAAVTDENAGIPAANPRSEGTQGPYGGIPGIFKKLADEAGLNYEVHNELIGGKTLEFHYTNALAVINQPKWDMVVLQEFSAGPVPVARTGNPENFTKYADLLEQTIHSANKSAKIFLYETWARFDLTKGPYIGEPIETMATDLHEGYYREFAHNGHFAGIAPAGDAWMRAIHANVAQADLAHPDSTKINLWGADSHHPSTYGAYLNALVLFGQITGKDSRALGAKEQAAAELGISPAMAVTLQRIAYEQLEEGKRAASKR
jgi:hypothetical protein